MTIIGFNNALANINSIVGADNQKAITAAIQSLKITSDNVARLSDALSKESGQITGIIRNTNSITGNLARNNDTIQRILSNTSRITAQIANAPLQKTITDLQKATAQMQGIMDKINNNQGSLGMLVNDKELYNNMNKSLKSVTELTNDLKARPGRYINVSVFGGKKKE
jgi:phospholipid/cholesterol/gamma-HCH transport system substrate-binding protein